MPKDLLLAVAVMLLAMPLAALADDAGEYTFTILMDGAPVGVHRVVFDRHGDRIDIQEATAIDVRLAMIPVYSFEHEGHQVWENGRVVRIDATTNDNGKELDIAVRPNGDGYIRTVNGRVDKFDQSTHVLAFWNRDTLKHHAFFSAAEDKTVQASFEFAGREEITIAGADLDVEHYRMVGGEERDLWYDTAGHIAKVGLRRRGSAIEYVRDQVTPRAPTSSCTALC
jgi:Family of unknown function (DUF6134)